MLQVQVEEEKLQLSCNILPQGFASESAPKIHNPWVQLVHQHSGLIAQDYLKVQIDDSCNLVVEVDRLGVKELGRYNLLVKYSYQDTEREREGRLKYGRSMPAFDVVLEERIQRLGYTDLVARGSVVHSIGSVSGSNQGSSSVSSESLSLSDVINLIKGADEAKRAELKSALGIKSLEDELSGVAELLKTI